MPTLKQLLDEILSYQAAGNSLETDYKIIIRPMLGADHTLMAPDSVHITKEGDGARVLMTWD